MSKRSIFISHSSLDKDYGLAISNLFKEITEIKVFFSSSDNQGVQVNEDIYGTLKKEIKNNSYVFCLLSPNYYDSPMCLNEMGAAWACGNEYALICLPEFNIDSKDFRRCAINTNQKVVHIENSNEMKQLVKSILDSFNLKYNEAYIHNKCINFVDTIRNIKKEPDNLAYIELWRAENKITENKKLAENYNNRGCAWVKLKKYENAMRDFLFSIFIEPNEIDAYYYLVQYAVESKNGYNKQALNIAEEMCKKFPHDHRSYGCRAFAKYHLNQIDDAIEDCDKALKIKKDRWHYNTRGSCLKKKGKYFEALSDYWKSHLESIDYTPPINHIKDIIKKITPETLSQEITKQQENGNVDLANLYINCLDLANK